jgi:flavin-dependent dehydrogenase
VIADRASAAPPPPDCDVLVVGGGPAGATIGALLAERGRRVVVVDKDSHPRFHIGESLLPLNLPLFERLGVLEEVHRIGMVKHCAEFDSEEHGKRQAFDFGRAWGCRWPHAYQVRRSELDALLLANCARRGAEVHEATRVTAVEFEDREAVRVTATGPAGERTWRARFLVDASGRDTFLAGRFGIKRRNPKHASAAIYGHFRNARRNAGRDEGNISIYWFQHGWFWFIPLKDGTTSVGAVCWPYYLKARTGDLTRFFLDTIQLAPGLAERLAEAELDGPATATGNYSYLSDRMAGDRYIMVGDAFAFVDPVFSSGVYLAMSSAFLGADAVEACLDAPAGAAAAQARFDRAVRQGLARFSWMIYRITSPAMRNLIMSPQNVMGIESAVISFLAGDVFSSGPVWRRLLAFRALYYLASLASLPTSVRAWARRRRNVRPVEGGA